MQTLLTVVVAVVGGFVALMTLMQVLVRLRAKALTGKPVPTLPGKLGKQVAKGRKALVYFMSPGCAACRAITPEMKKLSERNPSVYVIDVSRDLDTARALKVMATPSFVEIDDGKVVGFHVGPAPAEVLGRFG